MRNCTVGQVADATVHIDFFYEEGEKGSHQPVVRDIEVRNVTCRKSNYALYLRGFPSAPIRDVRVDDSSFDNVARENVIQNVEGLKISNTKINGKPV
jgi:hypothetical protein